MINAFLRTRFLFWLQLGALFFVVCLAQRVVQAEPAKPILVSEPTSTRAVALDALLSTSEPFSATPQSPLYGPDKPTSIMLFAMNLSLQPGEDASALTADAEDSAHQHYNLKVEYVGKVPGQDWLSQVNLQLDKAMGDVGDVLIRITYQGVNSNRVRVGIGHVGGGLEDDPGAAPTPAPPYTISGRIAVGTTALSGVSVTLSGSQTGTTTTSNTGDYSFTVTSVGNYIITPSKKFYKFTPSEKTFDNLSGNQTVNFNASLILYTISGIVKDDQGKGLDNVSLLFQSSDGNAPLRGAVTSNGGVFSFTDVPASHSYTITPIPTSLYAFTPQNTGVLDGDVSLTFNGTLRKYTISGVVADRSQHGTGGVSVTLSGPFGMSTVTDADGKYSFSNLPAGQTYIVAVAKTDYIFDPVARGYNLLRDEKVDFTAIRLYRISGRVTDANGKGIIAVKMSLSGAETATTLTGSDGSYSFTVTTAGNYTLTPSKEQDFYQFSPANKSLINLSDHQVVNFTGTIVITSPTHVLEFDGSPISVDYGIFWPADTNLGNFFWEFWAMPGDNTQGRYLLSDGYGGAHSLLFGFNYGPRGYSLFGNIWDGTQVHYFGSDEGPTPGEWGHYAVGWDGKNIITYYNGVPVGKQPFAGPRASMNTGWGATMLLIGGSNHQNLIGRIAQVRGYEDNNPRGSSPETAFAPQTVFSVDGQLLSYYFRPAERVADLSNGYNGIAHSGWPRGMYEFYFNFSCAGCPTPKFVIDPTAPDFSNPSNPGKVTTLIASAPPTPSGARVFDSFSRDNSTYILGGKGGLGTTETGTVGTKVWQTSVDASQPQPFGILGGSAVTLANATALAWVSTGAITGNLDVRVDRTLGAYGSGANTGLSFRVIDKNNYFFAYTSDDAAGASNPKRLSLGYYLSGVRTTLASNIAMPSGNWKTLRVVTTQTGSINVYADTVLVYSTTSTVNLSATGAGLYNNAAGLGLTNRWDNFTVLDVP